jgi:hypothetical protein
MTAFLDLRYCTCHNASLFQLLMTDHSLAEEEANRLADSLPDFEGIDNDSGNGSEEAGAAQAADDTQVCVRITPLRMVLGHSDTAHYLYFGRGR